MPPYRAQTGGLFGSGVYAQPSQPIDVAGIIDAVAGGARGLVGLAFQKRQMALAEQERAQAQADRVRAQGIQDEDRAEAKRLRGRAEAREDAQLEMQTAKARAEGFVPRSQVFVPTQGGAVPVSIPAHVDPQRSVKFREESQRRSRIAAAMEAARVPRHLIPLAMEDETLARTLATPPDLNPQLITARARARDDGDERRGESARKQGAAYASGLQQQINDTEQAITAERRDVRPRDATIDPGTAAEKSFVADSTARAGRIGRLTARADSLNRKRDSVVAAQAGVTVPGTAPSAPAAPAAAPRGLAPDAQRAMQREFDDAVAQYRQRVQRGYPEAEVRAALETTQRRIAEKYTAMRK